jgi:hypothetical protein
MCQLAEQHRDQLRPATEAFGPWFGVVFLDQGPKLHPGKMLEQLIEQTGCLYDWNALLFRDSVQDQPATNERILLSINYRRAFSLNRFSGLNSRAVLDKSEFVVQKPRPVWARTANLYAKQCHDVIVLADRLEQLMQSLPKQADRYYATPLAILTHRIHFI